MFIFVFMCFILDFGSQYNSSSRSLPTTYLCIQYIINKHKSLLVFLDLFTSSPRISFVSKYETTHTIWLSLKFIHEYVLLVNDNHGALWIVMDNICVHKPQLC